MINEQIKLLQNRLNYNNKWRGNNPYFSHQNGNNKIVLPFCNWSELFKIKAWVINYSQFLWEKGQKLTIIWNRLLEKMKEKTKREELEFIGKMIIFQAKKETKTNGFLKIIVLTKQCFRIKLKFAQVLYF